MAQPISARQGRGQPRRGEDSRCPATPRASSRARTPGRGHSPRGSATAAPPTCVQPPSASCDLPIHPAALALTPAARGKAAAGLSSPRSTPGCSCFHSSVVRQGWGRQPWLLLGTAQGSSVLALGCLWCCFSFRVVSGFSCAFSSSGRSVFLLFPSCPPCSKGHPQHSQPPGDSEPNPLRGLPGCPSCPPPPPPRQWALRGQQGW